MPNEAQLPSLFDEMYERQRTSIQMSVTFEKGRAPATTLVPLSPGILILKATPSRGYGIGIGAVLQAIYETSLLPETAAAGGSRADRNAALARALRSLANDIEGAAR